MARPRLPEPFGLVTRTQSERVHLVAGWSDIGGSIRQLRLRHRQRVEGFAQQLDLTSLCHQIPSEQMMDRSPGRSGACVRHILGERLLRRLDEDTDIVRREREVWIEFEQLVKERGDLADDLIAQTLAHVFAEGPAEIDLARYAESYLSQRQCQNIAGGCPTAALGSEATRQTPEARAAMTKGLRQHIERLSRSAKGKTATEKRRAAIGSWAAMVGAMIMARFTDDPKLSDELLAQTRAWIAGAATSRGRTVSR
jgi:hypothetical protein